MQLSHLMQIFNDMYYSQYWLLSIEDLKRTISKFWLDNLLKGKKKKNE